MTGSSNSSGKVIVHVFGRTDVGRTREHNEDTFAVADLTNFNASLQPEVRTHPCGERGSFFMVADGMGGAAAGEVASQMAVETILAEMKSRWCESQSADAETFAHALRSSTETANSKIHGYAATHPENRGMGTTATIAGLLGDNLFQFLRFASEVLHVAGVGRPLGVTRQAALAGFEEFLRPAVVEAFGDAFASAQFGDRGLAPQAVENDTNFLFGGELPPRGASDVFDQCNRSSNDRIVSGLTSGGSGGDALRRRWVHVPRQQRLDVGERDGFWQLGEDVLQVGVGFEA